jgi:hypothetical protein
MKTTNLPHRVSRLASFQVPLGIVLSWFVLLGCASVARRPESTTEWEALSRADLRAFQQRDTYEAIRELRPSWLQGHQAGSIGSPTTVSAGRQVRIHVDGIPQSGGPGVLRQIPARDVLQLHHLDAIDATTRFGTGYSAGVILVVTRAGGGGGLRVL